MSKGPDSILIVKTGALGDVLRTTSILPGLRAAHPRARIAWLTATGALDLLRLHPSIDERFSVDPGDEAAVGALGKALAARRWGWVLSFDDELPLCRLASALPAERLSGAHLDVDGLRAYTDDVAPWFDMGLLARDGKAAADRRKVENERSHPEIFAAMLGVEMGRPRLDLPEESLALARAFRERHDLEGRAPVIGLNTGAGGRWTSKQLSVERTVALVGLLHERLGAASAFVLFGGPEEAARNAALLAGLAALPGGPRVVDAGTDNALLDFAALVDGVDLLVTSDSLAMHVAIAREVRLVCFFAPTSAAEIELYGLGEKVRSTAPDYCSYRKDADATSITPERLADAVLRVLGR